VADYRVGGWRGGQRLAAPARFAGWLAFPEWAQAGCCVKGQRIRTAQLHALLSVQDISDIVTMASIGLNGTTQVFLRV
jgi:hypothetical protein